MSKTTTYKRDALAAVHDTASDMFKAGVIDKQTIRHFNESCLTPIHPFSAEEIKALREREKVRR
jgi:putative transcriptional regulator